MTTTCPLCGLVYEPGGTACRASACPLASESCQRIHCPRCGYAVPDEQGSVLARWVRRLFGEPVVTAEARNGPRPLAAMPAGTRGTIDRIDGPPALVAQLTAQGVVAGTPVELRQRHPGYVVDVGETTLAMERAVAEAIWVQAGGAPVPGSFS